MSNPNVRPDTLRCYACGEFKPDGMFYKGAQMPSRRYRLTECSVCMRRLAPLRRERAKSFEQVFQKMADKAMRESHGD